MPGVAHTAPPGTPVSLANVRALLESSKPVRELGDTQARASTEKNDAQDTRTPAENAPRPPAARRKLRVLVVGHDAWFGADESAFGGAVKATCALVRFVAAYCDERSVVAAATAEKYGGVRGDQRNGVAHVIGPPGEALGFALRYAAGDGADVAGAVDAVIAVDIRRAFLLMSLEVAKVARAPVFAFAHNYNSVPFGPFASASAAPVRPLLKHLKGVLATSEHLAGYIRTFAKGNVQHVRACPAFDYGYFDALAPPVAPPPSSRRFVTCISACPAKGLAIFLAAARSMPHIPFAAVATQWMQEVDRSAIEDAHLPNLYVIAANHDVGKIYSETRVLFAPSIWPEAFGLVAVEAALCGIPIVSSDVGGLPEANVDARGITPTAIRFDPNAIAINAGSVADAIAVANGASAPEGFVASPGVPETVDEMEQRRALTAAASAPRAIVAPYVAELERLIDEPAYYESRSTTSRDNARSLVQERRGKLARTLAELIHM